MLVHLNKRELFYTYQKKQEGIILFSSLGAEMMLDWQLQSWHWLL
jgi:hypothetical protein